MGWATINHEISINTVENWELEEHRAENNLLDLISGRLNMTFKCINLYFVYLFYLYNLWVVAREIRPYDHKHPLKAILNVVH